MKQDDKLILIIVLFAGLQLLQSFSAIHFADNSEEKLAEMWLLFIAAILYSIAYVSR